MEHAMRANRDLMAKVDLINQGLKFERTQQDVSDGTYFARKYDLDYQIKLIGKRLGGESGQPKPKVSDRKRDQKRSTKLSLLYKHL